MKALIAVLFLVVGVAVKAEDSGVANLVHQLRTLDRVEGSAFGSSARPGRYFLLAPYFIEYASPNEVRTMAQDRCPIVRLMAAQCVVKREDLADIDLDALGSDTQRIMVGRYGCGMSVRSLGEIVREIRGNPDYFFTVPESEKSEPSYREGEVTVVVQPPKSGSGEEILSCPEEH
jgi:hypothetical protein